MLLKNTVQQTFQSLIMFLFSMVSVSASAQSGSLVEISNPAGLYDPTEHGYSHLAVAKGDGNMIFIAGQGGYDNARQVMPATFAQQAQQAYKNVLIALNSANARVSDISRLTVLVVDHDETKLNELAQATKQIFKDKAPAMTLIPVPRLALEGMLVEIDAVAITRSR